MRIISSHSLRKAYKIALKIENLQGKLHDIIGDTLDLPPPIPPKPKRDPALPRRPRGRPKGSGKPRIRAGSIAGKKRPISPSGPLPPAVLNVLRRYNRPMNVNEILTGLEHDNYVWTSRNPRLTLYVRIGKLPGVQRVGEGLYAAHGITPVGIVPEKVKETSFAV